jgi:hypothetical protein
MFLCAKGHVFYINGDTDGSLEALKQAREIAAELKAMDNSELGLAIVALAAVLEEGEPVGSGSTHR